MFNSYYIHPKTAFKYKHTVCSVIYLIAFFVLISSSADNFTVEIIKDAACIAVIAIAAIIGKLDNVKEERRDEM